MLYKQIIIKPADEMFTGISDDTIHALEAKYK